MDIYDTLQGLSNRICDTRAEVLAQLKGQEDKYSADIIEGLDEAEESVGYAITVYLRAVSD